jgi:hypothetical protein
MKMFKRLFVFLFIFSLLSNTVLAEEPPGIPVLLTPVITSVTPNTGDSSSATNITINGSNFSSAAVAKINSTSLMNVAWVSSSQITATVPSGLAAGSYSISVVNPGNLTGTLNNAFTVTSTSNTNSGGSDSSPSGGGGSDQPTAGTGKIKGRIISTSGLAVLGTPARINDTRMATNLNGEFEFSGLSDGIYTVYYEADGYISQTQVLQVSGGGITNAPTVIMSLSRPNGKIKGRIINTSGTPVLGTPARIDASRAATNLNGEFEFTFVADGVYTLFYETPGYITQTQVLVVINGGTTNAPTVIMSPSGGSSISTKSVKRRVRRKRRR